jgi:predicted small secreted protein
MKLGGMTMLSPSHHNAQAVALSRNNVARNRRAGLLGLMVLFTAGLMLSGCNTTAGAGQDVKATGAAVTNGAEAVKSKL